MVASQTRQEARVSLTGKWGKVALLTLIYGLITAVISWVLNFIPVIGRIASAIISVPLAYGFLVGFIKIKRNEEVDYLDFFTTGFSMFGKLWGIIGHTLLKLLIPIIVLIVSIVLIAVGFSGNLINVLQQGYSSFANLSFSAVSIIGFIAYLVAIIWLAIKSFYYVLTSYILYDNPDLSSKEIVEKSQNLMTNNRAAYFWLQLTFIGWAILVGFTLGIGTLWLTPYMMVANTVFYEDKAGMLKQGTSKEE